MKAKTQDLAAVRWDDVRVFLAVYRAGSLGQAALRLAMDTSTVSRRLSAFEAGLAVALFDRARDGLAPTKAAKGLLNMFHKNTILRRCEYKKMHLKVQIILKQVKI